MHTLVAIRALMAVSLPPPNKPPSVLVSAALSRLALKVAFSSAVTLTLPPLVVTLALSI